MAFFVIESVDAPALAAYRESLDFRSDFMDGKSVRVVAGVHLQGELDDRGNLGPVHWLLVENHADEDNCTFRLAAPAGEQWLDRVEAHAKCDL
jgi:hypothetical protein